MKHLKRFNEGESFWQTGKRMIKRDLLGTYPEKAWIYITIYDDKNGFIKNEWTHNRVGYEINKILDEKFDLDFIISKQGKYLGGVNKFNPAKFDEVAEFLVSIGFERHDFVTGKKREYIFKIESTFKELKAKTNL